MPVGLANSMCAKLLNHLKTADEPFHDIYPCRVVTTAVLKKNYLL